ncbi:MAG: helix-turn-helix domain-containing protein, partial [Clostridia bacterium]|nr:helix-turn-helix domain-containing protein [Clostridia bacterium]
MFGKNTVLQKDVIHNKIYNSEEPFSGLVIGEKVEISLVTGGSGIIRILNEAYECSAGDLYILGSGIPHGYFAKNETEKPEVMHLSFVPSDIFSGSEAFADSKDYCCGVFRDATNISYAMMNSEATGELNRICEAISKELAEKKLKWKEAVKSNITLLLITLSRYIDMEDTAKVSHPKEWALVSAAMREAVKRCGDSDMTLESVASKLFISKSHLSRIFKAVTGENFADYVRNLRISTACNLLKSTNLTNEEIVRQCGLKDVPSFYKLFKLAVGQTPYQYRMSQQTYRGENMMSIYNEISENLQKGRAKAVKELVVKAVEDGLPAAQILNEALLAGISIVGERFKKNEVYVPEVLVAARAMNMGVEVLNHLLKEEGIWVSGKVC